MYMKDSADVVVIGMGPGGEEVAGRLAEAGYDVVGIDKRLLGGECPYWGCVPSKMMIRAANLLAEGRRIPGMAGESTVTPDWGPVAARIREATDNWDDRVAVERFEGKGGRFLRGEGRLIGPGQVQVGDRVIEAARAVVLATGTTASDPADIRAERRPLLDQPRRHRVGRPARFADRPRRRRHRHRAVPGVRSLRRPGDGRGGRRSDTAPGGA